MPDAVLRALDLTLRRRVSGLLPGEHRSAGTGDGVELALVRPYVPGDDVRRIDWNVTARTGEVHVRDRVAERVLTTWIVLDTSASMTFGTADRRKWDVAEGAAIVLAHVGGRRGNRVGLVAFGAGDPVVHPPRRGRSGQLAVLEALGEEPSDAQSGATSLGDALRTTGRLSRRGALVGILGDFRGPRDWQDPLTELAARHDVLVVEVRDPREQELPAVGHLWLVDPETGRQLSVNTSSRKLRERFAQAADSDRREVAASIARTGARHVVLSTAGDWLRPLAEELKRGPR